MTNAARVLAAATPAPATRARVPQGPVPLGPVDAHAERDAEKRSRSQMPDWSYAGIPLSRPEPTETLDVRVDGEGRPAQELLHGAPASAEATDARIHAGPAAADTASRAGADAVTVGSHILFAAGRFAPGTSEGARLLAHELAHVAQVAPGGGLVARRQPKPATAAVPATTLTGLPEADRKRIQVVADTPVTIPGIATSFAANAIPMPLPAGTTVEIDASAKGVAPAGLRNVAAQLVDPGSALPKNGTITVQLALAQYGGVDGLYRFTYHSPPVPPGGTAADRVLVEQLGAARPPAGTAVPQAQPGKKAPADPIAAKVTAAGITHSFTGAKLEALRAAVSLVPASQLALVKGVTIVEGTPGRAGEDGEYDLPTHTVTLKSSVFDPSDLRTSGPSGSVTYATYTMLHELGHAIDMAPLRKAEAKFLAAGRAQNATLAKNAPTGSYPLGGKEEAAIKAAEAATKQAKDALEKTQGRSGTTATAGSPTTFDTSGDAKGKAFREAVEKDGVAVTTYGATDWSEAYAEAYALYVSSPTTLQSLRPATFAHLKASLP